MGRRAQEIIERVYRFIMDHGLIVSGDRVLAAVSGGPDSVAMLDILVGLQKRCDMGLAVAHLDHRLRGPESQADLDFVRKLARGYRLEFFSSRAAVAREAERAGVSLETGARLARRMFLERVAHRRKFTKIALGHNQNDQAETVLMRLLRGSGPEGLAGIQPINGPYIRPLLDLSREEILEYLSHRGLPYRNDRSNESLDFLRNRIRHKLLPVLAAYNPRIVPALCRLADCQRTDQELIKEAVEKAAAECLERTKSEITIDLEKFKSYNKGLKRNIIRWCCQRLSGTESLPDYTATERALALAQRSAQGRRAYLNGGLWARIDYGRLRLGRPARPKRASTVEAAALRIPGQTEFGRRRIKACYRYRWEKKAAGPQTAWFDAAALAGQVLRVGGPRPGLRMRVFGSGGTRKIQDILVDAKVPRDLRGQWPIVYADDHPIWVAGLCRSDQALVTPHTRKIIQLELLDYAP